jgi:hypothetical protein
MELTIVINDIALTPKVVSLAKAEDPANRDALIREVHITFEGDTSSPYEKDGVLVH